MFWGLPSSSTPLGIFVSYPFLPPFLDVSFVLYVCRGVLVLYKYITPPTLWRRALVGANRTVQVTLYLTSTDCNSIDIIERKRRILFAGFQARMEAKHVMFGEIEGVADI